MARVRTESGSDRIRNSAADERGQIGQRFKQTDTDNNSLTALFSDPRKSAAKDRISPCLCR